MGPSIVADICLPAGIDPDLPVVQLQQEDWTSLYEQWQEWLLTVSSGNFHPHLDAFSGGLSVLGDQGAHQPGPESGDVRRLGSSSPAESVHKLLDQALRSTEVNGVVCCFVILCGEHPKLLSPPETNVTVQQNDANQITSHELSSH